MKYGIFLLGAVIIFYHSKAQPITLHQDNPHYFIFRGKPTVLISSAEHYGAVLNTEINYGDYLDVLQYYGFNQTRIFSGAYCEGIDPGENGGRQVNWESLQNTLAPRPEMLIAPWQRSKEAGYSNGGNKFDLDLWDEDYFRRLKDFCRDAGNSGVIVEIVFFTANYSPANWLRSPLQINNNINGVGDVPYNEFHLLKHKSLIDRQMDMVRKIVRELNEFDNVYYEICNEPYWMKGVPGTEPSIKEQQFLPEIDEWQQTIEQCITEAEKALPKKHMIAQNFANEYLKIQELNPAVSILNFHYAFPPIAVRDNYHLNRPVAFDETSGGCNAPDRSREAWAFMLAGGAEYSNLDWSFATDDLTGLGRNPSGRRQSGKEVRDQLKILKTTLEEFDFIHARPIDSLFIHGLPEGIRLYGLMKEGNDYLLYWMKIKVTDLDSWTLPLPAGNYEITFTDPVDGESIQKQAVTISQNKLAVRLPAFSDDMVMRITRTK